MQRRLLSLAFMNLETSAYTAKMSARKNSEGVT